MDPNPEQEKLDKKEVPWREVSPDEFPNILSATLTESLKQDLSAAYGFLELTGTPDPRYQNQKDSLLEHTSGAVQQALDNLSAIQHAIDFYQNEGCLPIRYHGVNDIIDLKTVRQRVEQEEKKEA